LLTIEVCDKNSQRLEMLKSAYEPELLLDCRIQLGESIIWDDREHLLCWVNIHDGEICMWNPNTTKPPDIVRLSERVGALGLRRGGGLVLALASGFALFDPKTSYLQRLADVEGHLPSTRLNDGRVDHAGRFVCAGMDEAPTQRPISALYALGTDRRVRELLGHITCANSLWWSLNGSTMYFTDMPTRCIEAFDCDIWTGEVANPRIFTNLADQPGFADGSVVDAEGCLWNAQWGGQ
jgi:L-arabinonolactonase